MNRTIESTALALLILVGAALACVEGGEVETTKVSQEEGEETARSESPESQAQPYEVVRREDTSFPGRRRGTLAITSDAATYEEFAQTAIKAAREEQERGRLDAVTVWLLTHADLYGRGFNYAQADYAPDGGGFSGDDGWRWQVTAVDTAWTDAQLRLRLLWESRRDEHTGSDGMLDEEALRRAVAAEVDVHPDSLLLLLPFLWPRDYEVGE